MAAYLAALEEAVDENQHKLIQNSRQAMPGPTIAPSALGTSVHGTEPGPRRRGWIDLPGDADRAGGRCAVHMADPWRRASSWTEPWYKHRSHQRNTYERGDLRLHCPMV